MHCMVCEGTDVVEQLDVGRHPVASFFLTQQDLPERGFSLRLGQCGSCGTVQLMEPVPGEALVPPYDWLFAREPEEHLDNAVEKILGLGVLGPDSVVGALTYKDDTTVDRFRRKGIERTWRVDPASDLGVTTPGANIETVQKLVSPDSMATIAERRGAADVLVVRHVTEHAENLGAFMAGLGAAVKPGGLVMIEIPDCTENLRSAEYCMVWEEHSLYFTPETFALIPALGGFETLWLDVYPRPFENSLVLVARKTGAPRAASPTAQSRAQVGMLAQYAEAYEPTKAALRDRLSRFRAEHGPIALFGAGHLAHAFANFLDVADLIDFVADDTPQKQGKFLPGARLPILPSSALAERGVKLCLLALSINNEDAVIGRNAAFVEQGGVFRSVFRSSPRSVFGDGWA